MGFTMMIFTLLVFYSSFITANPKAWTLSLTTLAIFQWFNAWNVRSEKNSAFYKPFSNPYLLLGLLGAVLFHLLAVYHPFMQKILRTVALDFYDWLIVIALSLPIVLVEEVRKIILRFKS